MSSAKIRKIRIYTIGELIRERRKWASLKDVMDYYSVGICQARRLMFRSAGIALIVDYTSMQIQRYYVIPREDLPYLHHRRGNPYFADSDYQEMLAERRWYRQEMPVFDRDNDAKLRDE